ncbi:MAG: hypothetical protein IJI32_03135 [Clostridia bacterium]|nr:hypothetical protein [Clostridia bacterium]MBQ6525603.1 hypothetical protein [Clostridia bacterium]
MRKTRKFLAALLAMVMAMSVFCLTAFAGEKKTYTAYTFFGDSVTAAAGLPSYYTFFVYNPETGKYEGTAEGQRVLGSYPDLVAQGVGINNGLENYYNESHSGWRTSEVRELLDPDYYNDDGEVAKALSLAMANGKAIADPQNPELREDVREEIAASDLITLDLGSNDIQLPIIMTLYSVLNPTASEDYKAWMIEKLLQKYGSASELINNLAQTVASLHGVEFALEQIAKATLTGLHKFNTNYPVIIDKILEINPTADIYVIGLYNPLSDTLISEDLPIKIGKILDPMIQGMNLYLSQLNPARGHYTYVDAFNTAVLGTINVSELFTGGGLSAEGMGEYTLYVHPSLEGHAYIADQVLKAIPDKPAVLNGIVKGEDGRWALYRNNKVVTSATGIYQNEKGWWRVKDGYVDFEANGIYQNALGWWKTTNGKVTFKETGIFQNENGKWYVRNSKVDFTKFGRVKYDGKYYYVAGGKVVA